MLTSKHFSFPRLVRHATACVCVASLLATTPTFAEDQVRMQTAFGDFFINLTPDVAPLSVENFLDYVNSGAYDDSFFHRNPGGGGDPSTRFVLQGGEAFWPAGAANFLSIPENAPVQNEFNVSNTRGTVALAKLGGDPNSGTNNFFINLVDNGANLDTQNGGFTVFGTVNAAGMEVIDEIASLPIANVAGFTDIPIADPLATVFNRNAVVLISSAEAFSDIGAPAAAILPASRSVSVGNTATGFATIVNTSTEAAASCSMQPSATLAAEFSYRRTNPATNQAFGSNNPLVDIPAQGSATLVFSLTPTAAITSSAISFDFTCGNATSAAALTPGVNTFELAASTTPIADVVALAGTVGANGITDIPNTAGSGAFVVATVNLGAAETIRVSADTGGASLPIGLFVCPTDAASGECTAPAAVSATTTMASGATGTFAVFAQLTGAGETVPFDPAGNRAFVRFENSSGELRGSTSVALRTVP